MLMAVSLAFFGCGGDVVITYVSPPAGVQTIEVGSGGNPTGEVGGTDGTIYTVVIDQGTLDPITDLLRGNIEITITPVGGTAGIALVGNMENMAGKTPQPISFGLTLDRSVSMTAEAIASMESAATSFVNNMGSSDQVAIANFGYSISVDQGLTSNKTSLISAIENPSAVGSSKTALYDSIATIVGTVSAGSNPRKTVIALTNGGNNRSISYSTTTEVINFAISKNMPVYSVGLGFAQGSSAEKDLQAISKGTGGIYYYSSAYSDLLNLYSKISTVLNSYYVITFTLPSGWVFVAGQTYTITLTIINYGNITGSVTYTLTT